MTSLSRHVPNINGGELREAAVKTVKDVSVQKTHSSLRETSRNVMLSLACEKILRCGELLITRIMNLAVSLRF